MEIHRLKSVLPGPVRTLQFLGILLEQLCNQAAQALSVSRFHMHEFHAGARRRNVAHDGGELNLAEPAANFQLHGIHRPPDADRFRGTRRLARGREHAPTRCAVRKWLPASRTAHGRAHTGADPRIGHHGFQSRAFRDSRAGRCRAIFQEGQRILGRGPQRAWLIMGQPVAFPHDAQERWRRLRQCAFAQGLRQP